MKIERLDAKSGDGANLAFSPDSEKSLLSIIDSGQIDRMVWISNVVTAKAVYHVLGEWIKTKEADGDEGFLGPIPDRWGGK